MPRIYFPHNIKVGDSVTLDIDASRHLLQVLRLKCGAKFLIFNGQTGEFDAVIIAIHKNIITAKIESFIARDVESRLSIHLGQGIARGEKMDFIIQKSVELGVNKITPLFTEYCNVKLEAERLAKRNLHWQKVAQSASEQAGRCYVPEVTPSEPITNWNLPLNTLCLVLDPAASTSLHAIKAEPKEVALLVGPEGGLSPNEILLAKSKGFLPIKLGPRILRTETAALVAISILQYKWGDLEERN